jgi:hypothetical protein
MFPAKMKYLQRPFIHVRGGVCGMRFRQALDLAGFVKR